MNDLHNGESAPFCIHANQSGFFHQTVCSVLEIRKAYNKAIEGAIIADFNNHDLRHYDIDNMRVAGNDHFVIKEGSGAKTDSTFQRYNLVTKQVMKGIKWLDLKSEKSRTKDSYMDINIKKEIV